MEGEVWVFTRQLLKLIIIEHLSQRACPVPEADFALAPEALELVKNVRTHRCHARATTDKDHFSLGLFSKELAKRTGDGHLISRFQGPDIRRHDARGCIRHIRRRRGDTHVEHNDALLVRVVGH